MKENGSGNNHSDEKDGVFGLVRKEDPNQLKAIRVRERACDDAELSDGSVRLFVRLLDMALNPFLNMGARGQIIVSQRSLGGLLNCDERSIRRRTEELMITNYVWTTLVPRPNTKPMLCYHITEFQPKRQVEMEVPMDGVWGNGKRRYDSGFARTGNRATGRQRRVGSGLVDRFGKPIFADLLENEPPRGHEIPLSPVKSDRSQRTQASSDTGQNCPVTEDSSVRSHRSELSAPTGQNCPLDKDADVRHIETPVLSKRDIGVSLSSSTKVAVARAALETLPKLLSGSPALRNPQEPKTTSRKGEKEWLLELGAIVGPKEMANWGGRWRNRYRENSDKAERLLAEMRCMRREGRIYANAGACADDLWKRFAS